jgi:hypothetical protein
MRTVTITLALIAAVTLSTRTTDAQSKPNFSGTWTRADPKPSSDSRARDGSTSSVNSVQTIDRSLTLNNTAFACGDECTIVQTATTLTVKRPPNAQGVAPPDVVLYLDGRENKNLDASRIGQAPIEYVSRATWDGATLVTTRPTAQGKLKSIRSLALDAGTLVIVTTTDFPGMHPVALKYTKR